MAIWFRGGYFLYVWDTTYPINAAAYLSNFSDVWRSIYGTGHLDTTGVTFLPYFTIVYGLQNLLGLPLQFAEAVLYYLLITASAFGMYSFTSRFLSGFSAGSRETRLMGLLSAVFYVFNMYTMYYLWRIFSAEDFLLAFLPLMLYEFWAGLEDARNNKKINLWRITRFCLWSLFAIPGFSNPGFILTTLVLFSILFVFAALQPPRYRLTITRLKFISLLGIAWLSVNLWWVLPYLVGAGPTIARFTNDITDLQSNSLHSSVFNVIRLLGMPPQFQPGPPATTYDFNGLYSDDFIFVAISCVIPILCFAPALSTNWLKERSIFVAGLSVPFIVLAAGLNPPFGPAFAYLYQNYKFMIPFRDPYQKFGWIVMLCYSMLFAIGVLRVSHIFRKIPKVGRLMSWLVPLFLVGLVICVYSWPFFTGDVITSPAKVSIPEYYQSASSWIESQPGPYRILSLPLDLVLQGANWEHGYVGNDILRAMTGKVIISTLTPDTRLNDVLAGAQSLMDENNSYVGKVLGAMNVKYILIRGDADLTYARTQTPVSTLQAQILNQTGIALVATFGPLSFFENGYVNPLVYAPESVFFSGSISQPQGVVWDLANYSGGWVANDPHATLSQGPGFVSLSFNTDTTHPYTFFQNSKSLNVSIAKYPNLLLTFRTQQNTMLSVSVKTGSGKSSFLYAVDPPPLTRMGNAYQSDQPYTLAFPLIRYFGVNDSVDRIYINVSPTVTPPSLINASISDLRFAASTGSPIDDARIIASPNYIPNSMAITYEPVQVSGVPPKIDFQEIRPSEYRVTVTQATAPFLLVLGEMYDANWQIIGGSSSYGSFIDAVHVIANGFANGWLVNKMGSFTATLFYSVQRLVEWGAYIFPIFIGTIVMMLLLQPPSMTRLRVKFRLIRKIFR